MHEYILIIICVVIAYLIGSISPSIVISKLNNVDIMAKGSKNAGSTNVLRILGPKFAAIVLTLDITKGFITVFLVGLIIGQYASYFTAVAVIVGHCFSVFHHFKAGKGVATGLGAVLAVDWRIALLILVVAAILFIIFKRVSVASLTGALSLPFFAYFLHYEFLPFAIVITLLIFFTHRSNIKRLINKEEAPLSFGGKTNKKNNKI